MLFEIRIYGEKEKSGNKNSLDILLSPMDRILMLTSSHF